MITIDSILSKKNIVAAFEHFSVKKNGSGTDRSDPTELKTYWEQNGERIKEQIRSCTYNPGIIAEYEIINGKGKRRVVTKFNDVDRLITRLLSQKMGGFYGPMFLDNSCAYQDNKGIITATDIARNYIESGNEFVVEIDIEHFFDEIDLGMLYSLLENSIKDKAVGLYDRFGDLLGYFIPHSYSTDSKILLQQCLEYSDDKKRLKTAKAMEIAAIHNIRANIRYYIKKNHPDLESVEELLSQGIKDMNDSKDVDSLLLIEARCRQNYYHAFNSILCNKDFVFDRRTKRPPLDAINALISFGNTILYNRIQQMIWKTALDSRIGIFHAANKRNCSLNLDFADLFKPLTVDRTIFTIINRGQIRITDFVNRDDGGVYLNDSGKRMFIEIFEEKMSSRLTVKDKQMNYNQLINREIYNYLAHIKTGCNYKPYKYY